MGWTTLSLSKQGDVTGFGVRCGHAYCWHKTQFVAHPLLIAGGTACATNKFSLK